MVDDVSARELCTLKAFNLFNWRKCSLSWHTVCSNSLSMIDLFFFFFVHISLAVETIVRGFTDISLYRTRVAWDFSKLRVGVLLVKTLTRGLENYIISHRAPMPIQEAFSKLQFQLFSLIKCFLGKVFEATGYVLLNFSKLQSQLF